MKDQPFLNDPAAYPEFSLLIKRQSLQHAIRQTLHRQRTSALLVVVAMSIAASGADGSGGNSSAEWGVYLAKGMHLALLQKHFEGIVSALGCMVMGTVTSFLVYPIYQRCSPATIQNPRAPSCRRVSSATTKTIAAAVPSMAVWAIAVYVAGVCRWGVASGLCVGLQCAALTLKSVSFVQKARPVAAEAAIAVAAAHEDLDAAGVAANADGGDHAAAASGKLAISPACRSVLQGDPRSNSPSPTASGDDGGARAANPALTFREFAFFLVLAPSLVCRPQYLASGARRPPRVAAAASEFLHAGLTYIAVHVACSALFAPALRVLAEALHSAPHRWQRVVVARQQREPRLALRERRKRLRGWGGWLWPRVALFRRRDGSSGLDGGHRRVSRCARLLSDDALLDVLRLLPLGVPRLRGALRVSGPEHLRPLVAGCRRCPRLLSPLVGARAPVAVGERPASDDRGRTAGGTPPPSQACCQRRGHTARNQRQ
ncbi:unnamed protein product [Ectocarpus sp. 12 AP-2014]